jgi:hypothetical protein
MSTSILIEVAVGQTTTTSTDGSHAVTLAGAQAIAAIAQEAGVAGLRLVDGIPQLPTIDPSVTGSYLAARYGGIGYLIDVATSHNAPYNTARRVLSLDRAAGGATGLVLRPGLGDEVSDAAVPVPAPSGTAERWAEYASILGRLWESFPREALIGDQHRAVVTDDTLIRAIAHEGTFYRVAGPLDGPSSVQGRPVLAAADLELLGWAPVARSADVVIVEPDQAAGADQALSAALKQAGRSRAQVALLGRSAVTLADAVQARTSAHQLAAWVHQDGLDGLSLAPDGGPQELAVLLNTLAALLPNRPERTLRASLGLDEVAAVLA